MVGVDTSSSFGKAILLPISWLIFSMTLSKTEESGKSDCTQKASLSSDKESTEFIELPAAPAENKLIHESDHLNHFDLVFLVF